MPKRPLLIVLAMLYAACGFSQQTARYTSDYADFEHGIKLFNQHQYTPAQRIFERVGQHTQKHNLKAKTSYYAALAAVHLQQPDAEARMRHFVANYRSAER